MANSMPSLEGAFLLTGEDLPSTSLGQAGALKELVQGRVSEGTLLAAEAHREAQAPTPSAQWQPGLPPPWPTK